MFSGIAHGAFFAALFTLVIRRSASVDENRRTTAVIQTTGYCLAAVGPVVMGWVHEHSGGWVAPFAMVVGVLVLMTVCAQIAAARATPAGPSRPFPPASCGAMNGPKSKAATSEPGPAGGRSSAGEVGELPAQVIAPAPGGAERPFSVYLHVPYCRVRCGYCDFNTYTNLTMGQGASAEDFVGTLAGELRAARRVMDRAGLPVRAAQTVFVGGGTPTMLPATDLVSMLELVRECFGLAADAEVTTEANPDSVDEAGLAALAEGGFTRVSFGMQSAVPHVLKVLERTHEPARGARVVDGRDGRA